MSRSLARLTVAGLALTAGLLGALAPGAGAASGRSLLSPPIVQPPVVAPVAVPASWDPEGPVKGTVIMVHAGGWAGHDANAENILLNTPGTIFHDRGWRVVSIDYNEGAAGLDDVLSAASDELLRNTTDGPLCIYGESSGAHLALVAAARLRAIDCVIGLGTPTDLPLYEQQAAASADDRVRLVAEQAGRFFGTTPEATAPWNPIALAPQIHADVLLMYEGDDAIVPPAQSLLFQAARPTTQVVGLEAGDPNDPSTKFVHGTISPAGRAAYAAAIGSFADRSVASRDAEIAATRTGCARTNRSLPEIGMPKLAAALRCLARKDVEARRAGTSNWQMTSLKVRGEVNAARLWANLRTSTSGKRALAAFAKRRASLIVRASDRSRVIVRMSH